MAIKGVIDSEQPREKAMVYGIECLTNQELLAILIRSGSKKESALSLANRILSLSNGINNMMNISISDLMSIDGIKKAKALTIIAALELTKRIRQVEKGNGIKITNSNEAYEYVRSRLEYETQEKVLVLYVNSKSEVLKEKIIFMGSLNVSLISSKEIIKEGLLCNAKGFFLFHNHPSGSSIPSSADIESTKKIQFASLCLDIQLIDHIVVGHNEFFSFKNHGIID